MTDELAERFIDTVESQVGYKSLPGIPTSYGQAVGYPLAEEWSGAFLEWASREVGLDLTPLTDTTYAREAFDSTGRMFRKPRRGDLVFVPGERFQQWKVGLITRVDRAENGLRRIEAVFGNVVNPSPRATSDRPGVFKVTLIREVQGYVYARPKYRLRAENWTTPTRKDATVVRVSDLTTGRANGKVRAVQAALTLTGRLTPLTGKWDRATREQFASFQRSEGWVGDDADGSPTNNALRALQWKTGEFEQRD